jgi:hypothetical protein
MSDPTLLARDLARLQRGAFGVGIAGLALLAVGFAVDRERFHQAWLMAWLFWLGPTLGSLGVVLLHNMTGGAWGFAIKRLLEASLRNLPLVALLFVPVCLGIPSLYEWSDADAVAADVILQRKAAWLNVPFFVGRALLYFALWTGFAFWMLSATARYDRRLDTAALRRTRTLSGMALALYVLSMSFASFDWGMSLEPHWYSTIYGVQFVVGQVLSTFCLAIVLAARLSRYEPFSRWIQPAHFQDLGNLLMAFVMLWAYVSLSQFLIVWSANLPEETPYYLKRLGEGWQGIALVLVVFHFAVPFLVLVNRIVKRDARSLASVAAALFVVRYLDVYWLIAPSFGGGDHLRIRWMDAVAPIALGGLWLGMFARNLRGRPLVSLQDAKLLGELEEAAHA